MFCTQCGKQGAEGALYCAFCGARVRDEAKQQRQDSRPRAKRTDLGPARLAQGVGAVVTIGLALYWILVPAKEGPQGASRPAGQLAEMIEAQRAKNTIDWGSAVSAALVSLAVAAVVFAVLYVGALLAVRWIRARRDGGRR